MPLGRGFKLRGGAGLFRQFPSLDQAFGSPFPDTVRGAERAYHADVGLEQTIGSDARWQVTFYNREERDLIREFIGEPKVEGDHLDFAVDATRNALDGHARGVEFLLQRKSSHGLSGWFSYSLGLNRYRDYNTGESFDGDFDQRHTINTHGVYRVTDRFSLAGKFRYGSNVPAIGYYENATAPSSSDPNATESACPTTRASTFAPAGRSTGNRSG